MRILMIGNSFSDDTAEYLYQIAVDAGVKAPEIGNLYIPGCPVSLHALNAREDRPAYEYRENTDGHWVNTPGYKLSTALTGRQWDFISLQQASGLSRIFPATATIRGACTAAFLKRSKRRSTRAPG